MTKRTIAAALLILAAAFLTTTGCITGRGVITSHTQLPRSPLY